MNETYVQCSGWQIGEVGRFGCTWQFLNDEMRLTQQLTIGVTLERSEVGPWYRFLQILFSPTPFVGSEIGTIEMELNALRDSASKWFSIRCRQIDKDTGVVQVLTSPDTLDCMHVLSRMEPFKLSLRAPSGEIFRRWTLDNEDGDFTSIERQAFEIARKKL